MKCSITAQARLDLREIYLYIAEDSLDRADALRQELEAATDQIAAMPFIGHKRRDLTTRPVLFWTVRHFHIVYRPDKTPPHILRIVSAYQDLRRVLRDE